MAILGTHDARRAAGVPAGPRAPTGGFGATLQVQGLAEMRRALTNLPKRVRSGVIRHAIRAAARTIVRAAKPLAPRETGLLRRSLAARAKTYRSGGVTLAVIGPRSRKDPATGRNAAKYAHLVELGHAIAVGGRVRLTGLDRARGRTATGRSGGYVPGRHFLGRAARSSAAAAAAAFAKAAAEKIEKEGKKLGDDAPLLPTSWELIEG